MIQHFLDFVKDYDVFMICVIVFLSVCAGIREFKEYISMTKEDRYKAIMTLVKKEILKLMCEAESRYSEYKKSGKLKELQVISDVYDKFPELLNFKNQSEIVDDISKFIENEMDAMNKLMNNK